MSLWIDHIKSLFLRHQNSDNAQLMKRYMKDLFPFYGIQTPQRKQLVKESFLQNGIPSKEDWASIALLGFEGDYNREIQYAVGDLLRPRSQKHLTKNFLPVIEQLIQTKSWWDTVDWLSPKLAGAILQNYPEEKENFPDRWIASSNIWLVRSAILYQLSYKEKVEQERLKTYCLRHRTSQEFFVQKAMGWMLREYSKTNKVWVSEFLSTYELPKLTLREGSKYLSS